MNKIYYNVPGYLRCKSLLYNNFIILKRIWFPAAYKAQLFDDVYADKAERHALKSESNQEQFIIVKWLSDLKDKPKSILDIGCNTGRPLDYICRQFSCEGSGVDVNKFAIEKAAIDNRNNKFLHYDGHNLPFENESFDHIMLHHVLGHVENPEKIFSEISRILKKNGTLSVITTNCWYQFWQIPWNIINGFRPDITILRFYSASKLRGLIKKHNLKSEIILKWNPEFSSRQKPNFCKLRLMAFARKP